MASRENSKADSQTSSDIKAANNQSPKAIASSSPAWKEPPLSWLSEEQQILLQNQSDILDFRLGEKIWYQEAVGYQFFIVSGKVRLREEGVGKPIATLAEGEWFGSLNNYPTECKAVAASKEVLVLRTTTDLWAELSTPQIEEFWQGKEKRGQGDREIGRWGDKETRR